MKLGKRGEELLFKGNRVLVLEAEKIPEEGQQC